MMEIIQSTAQDATTAIDLAISKMEDPIPCSIVTSPLKQEWPVSPGLSWGVIIRITTQSNISHTHSLNKVSYYNKFLGLQHSSTQWSIRVLKTAEVIQLPTWWNKVPHQAIRCEVLGGSSKGQLPSHILILMRSSQPQKLAAATTEHKCIL
jgi:hypothetical protein